MTISPFALLDDTVFDAHHDQGAHPECPERLVAAREGIRVGLGGREFLSIPVRLAETAELTRIHRGTYVSELDQALRAPTGHLDPDTFFSAGSRLAAWSAAGGAINLVDAVWTRNAQSGVALVRPPGHHAEANRAMGFCLLNNVAIAAASLLERGAKRIAIVDWDVHHGNGTQHSFYSDPRVLFISLHQWPFYPGTGAAREIGAGAGLGFTVNVPLPAQSGPEAYASAFRRVVLPILKSFSPEMILVSAGFDAHARDPLASMQLDTESYRAMASSLIAQAIESGRGRIAWILEGGYDLSALSASVAAVTSAAIGNHCELAEDSPTERQSQAIDAAVSSLQAHWPCLR